MQNVFVAPAKAGTILRDPVTKKPLAAAGEWKPKNQFWQRRIIQGDVVDNTRQQQAAQAAPAAKAPAPSVRALDDVGPAALSPAKK